MRPEAGGSPGQRLWIEGPAGRLEANVRAACAPRGAALLAHPHPLHGGTLHNPVVFHADRELSRAGLTTLRFNFRGVGTSEGSHDDGRGEAEDLAAAARWLRGVVRDVPLLLLGYSFGSWCAIRHAAAGGGELAGVIAIGLPLRVYPFLELRDLRCPLAVVQGSEDEFGTPDEVRTLLDGAGLVAPVLSLPGASHLFPGRAPDAARLVLEAAETLLRSAPGPGGRGE